MSTHDPGTETWNPGPRISETNILDICAYKFFNFRIKLLNVKKYSMYSMYPIFEKPALSFNFKVKR